MNKKYKVVVPRRQRRSGEMYSEISFSGNLADAIFSKKILKNTLPLGWNPEDLTNKYDSYNVYTLNSYNCRGPEFKKDIDFIFAGCSQTLGIGVPDDGIWPEFLANSLNASYVNLSMLGASMEWITDSIYRYINTFGKPKRGIVFLAPDWGRLDLMVNGIINICNDQNITDYIPQYYDVDHSELRLVTHHLPHKEITSYMKRPFPVSDTTIEEEAIRRAIKAIKDLEIFCEQTDIPLIWSTWHEGLDRLATELPEEYKFKNFISVTNVNWKSNNTELKPTVDDPEGLSDPILDEYGVEIYCHFDLLYKFPLAFHKGTDRYKFKDQQSHMGVHRHIHIADSFYEKAIELGL